MATKIRWKSKFKVKNSSWVFVPNYSTKIYGKKIKSKIENLWEKPNYYFHLRDGGHVEALKSHLSHRYFIHTDIKDFFGCINKSRLTRNLKIFFDYKTAREIAEQSTVQCPNSNNKKHILPFGFVQSPILASLCLHKSRLGAYLENLNMDSNFAVSVYMDDIVISSDCESDLQKILSDLLSIAEHSHFQLNKDKTELSSRIIVFNVELSFNRLKINNKRIEKFVYDYINGNQFQKDGILGYIFSINPKQLDRLVKNLRKHNLF